MRPFRRLSLYGSLFLLATPAAALPPDAVEALRAARAGEMESLVIHDDPKPAVEAAFEGPEGETRLTDWPGKVVFVNLWATWCPPCLKEMPAIDALAQAMEGEDFEVVAVSTDRGDPMVPQAWLDEAGVETLELFHDPDWDLQTALAIRGQPTSLILDREGREIARYEGEADWASDDARAMMEAAIEATAGER